MISEMSITQFLAGLFACVFACVFVRLSVRLSVFSVYLNVSVQVPLVYASSSSVYGHHSPLPFDPAQTLAPFSSSNIYAATKVSNEIFAATFCRHHNLKTIGLRFFTVYGPWGRPDMAVYKFTQKITEKRNVTVYESFESVSRDFTFVSDVVSGLLLALDHTPSRCGEVYNIGTGQSVELGDLLRLLETELNQTARVVSLPIVHDDDDDLGQI